MNLILLIGIWYTIGTVISAVIHDGFYPPNVIISLIFVGFGLLYEGCKKEPKDPPGAPGKTAGGVGLS